MSCNDSPNSLPINEMEIPPETEMGNPPIIVDAPKESPHSPVQADPGLRQLICTFPVNEQDRIRREYLLMGPHQPKLNNYPQTFDGREKRRFQHRWFTLYSWLEYSEARDRAFCFPCFLFEKNPPRYPVFTVEGCCNWGRMLAGKNGICVQHIGKLNSIHQKNVQSWADLLRTSQHIDRVIDRLPPEIVRQNRLRLKTTIAAVKYLGKEGLPFRGHDESSNSSLKRAGTTRWGSHFASVTTLVHVFKEVTQLFQSMMADKELTGSIRGDAKGFLKALRAFEFVFCLLLTNKIMGITDLLSQALQKQSQDIVNAMNLVSSTKALLQALRDDGWDSFYQSLHQFGEHHGLEMPNMDAAYSMGTGRGCQQHDVVTNEHYYHFDVFNVIIDVQLMELHDRFTEQSIELLTLSSALDPKNQFKKFDMEKICRLAEKFYPEDFDASEVRALMLQLEHYKHQVVFDKDFQKLSSLAQLCRRLVEAELAKLFPLVDRLIRLVLTLPVSTATTERAFSAMKIIKTRLRNKMEDRYLSGCMMLHIEKEYVDDIDSETVIDHFESIGDRRAQFK
ncbi:unnamed protein product [Rhodiola kirilowii]